MERAEKNLKLLLFSGAIAIAAAVLAMLSMLHRPLPPDGDPILGGPQLVLFETDACAWCTDFRRVYARDFAATDLSAGTAIRYISIDEGPPPKRYRLYGSVQGPAVVFFDPYGRELDRIVGDPKSADQLVSLVSRNLRYIAKY